MVANLLDRELIPITNVNTWKPLQCRLKYSSLPQRVSGFYALFTLGALSAGAWTFRSWALQVRGQGQDPVPRRAHCARILV